LAPILFSPLNSLFDSKYLVNNFFNKQSVLQTIRISIDFWACCTYLCRILHHGGSLIEEHALACISWHSPDFSGTVFYLGSLLEPGAQVLVTEDVVVLSVWTVLL